MENREEEYQFIDAENWQGQQVEALTYEQVVINQIRRTIEEGSKEMRGGYVKYRQTTKGVIEEYVPDQRQVFIQCIQRLYDLLLNFFDDEMREKENEFNKLSKNTEDKIKKIIEQKIIYTPNKLEKKRISYQFQYGYLETDSVESKISIDEKLESYRFLFQQLILLYNRKRFLMTQDIID